MPGFVQRFSTDPGLAELTRIEAVDIIDRTPPANVLGVGSGTVCLVGEFENGPFNKTTEILGGSDLLNTFGGFGYTYAGIGAKNPCARLRQADGALVSEFWNGNSFVHLVGKRFNRLLLVRVDTSVGNVQLTRLASILGASKFRYSLITGQTVVFTRDAQAPVTATFTGVAATVTGAAGTFNPLVGESCVLGWDGQPNFTVAFDGTENTVALDVARINQFAGFAFAAVSGGQIALTGRQAGTGGQVRVVSGTAGTLTKLGLAVANTAGTGNVANISAVTPAEVNTVITAADAVTKVDTTSNGSLRIFSTTATSAGAMFIGPSSTAADFGFVVSVTDAVGAGNGGVIPAGTLVRNTGSTVQLVTMQDVVVTPTNAGPYTVKVRHATDDLTGLTAAPGAIVVVDATTPIDLDAFAVVNTVTITPCLTDAQIDAQYATAIAATLNVSDVSREINIICSARQSNSNRRNLKTNTITASKTGLFGRVAISRPPLNTAVATAESTSAEPGVGAYRNERLEYNYPGFNVNVPAIALVGTAGGTGFTADGNMDVGSDVFLASVLSQLNPEEDPGQLTDFLSAVNGLETGAGNSANSNSNLQGWTIDTYKSFKASGICAPRIENGLVFFQSGVTSVDPASFPQLSPISRRRMADFIQDSLSIALKPNLKKLLTTARQTAIKTAVRDFLTGLQSPTNANLQRIVTFSISDKQNTKVALAAGVYRLTILVQLVPSLKALVLDTTIGETVQIDIAA